MKNFFLVKVAALYLASCDSDEDSKLLGVYNISVLLENAILKNETGKQLNLERLELKYLKISWFSG